MKRVLTFKMLTQLTVACAAVFYSGKALAQEPQELKGITAAHNYWRTDLGIRELKWSDKLAEVAKKWGEYLSTDRQCALIHSRNEYGENLYWTSQKGVTPTEAVEAWASERFDYDIVNFTCREGKVCGHYTQIIWETTTEVGCAAVVCQKGYGTIVVCNYNPPGNYIGRKPFNPKK